MANEGDKKASWTSPPTVIALIGLGLSLLGNVVQGISTNRKDRIAKERHERDIAILEEQLAKLRDEAEQRGSARRACASMKASLEADLAKAREDLAVWTNALFTDGVKLTEMKADIRTRRLARDTGSIRYAEENVRLQEEMIETKKAEKAAVEATIAKLEKQLESC